jgi:hypothetical protein
MEGEQIARPGSENAEGQDARSVFDDKDPDNPEQLLIHHAEIAGEEYAEVILNDLTSDELDEVMTGIFSSLEEGSFCRYGLGGHENEYVAHIGGHDADNPLPHSLERDIREHLGVGFQVDNRGSRLEITTRDSSQYDEVVLPIVYDRFKRYLAGHQ